MSGEAGKRPRLKVLVACMERGFRVQVLQLICDALGLDADVVTYGSALTDRQYGLIFACDYEAACKHWSQRRVNDWLEAAKQRLPPGSEIHFCAPDEPAFAGLSSRVER